MERAGGSYSVQRPRRGRFNSGESRSDFGRLPAG